MVTPASDKKGSRGHRRRALRFGLYSLISLAGLCVLAVVLVSSVEPIRNGVLVYALRRIDQALPGDLSVSTARWSALGSVDVSGILWTSPEDTLCAVDTLRVSVRLLPLLRKDLQVSELSLLGVTADVEALQSILPAGEKREEPEGRRGPSRAFPRDGEIPSTPSIAVEKVRVGVSRVRLNGDLSLSGLRLEGNIDLLRGHDPRVKIDQLSMEATDEKWKVSDGELRIDVARGRAEGKFLGKLGTQAFALGLSSPEDETIRITVSAEEGALDEGAWGADLSIKADRKDYVPQTLGIDVNLQTPGTHDLAAIPDLAGFVEGLPELEGVRITGNGTLAVWPAPEGALTIAVLPNSWIDGGAASLSYEDETFRADTVSLRFPDLMIGASATLTPDQIRAKAVALVRGTGLLRRLQPEASWPDSLFLDLNASVIGSPSGPTTDADLLAAFRFGTLVVDEVRARAQLRPEGSASLELAVRAMDLVATTRAEILLADTLTVEMSPVHVVEARAGVPKHPPTARGATIRVDGASGDAVVRGFRVRGALGEGTLDGRYSPSGTGSFRLSWTWPQPPLPLLSRLPLEKQIRDSVTARWDRDETFRIFAEGKLGVGADPRSLQAEGLFVLPGPRVWGPAFLPPQVEVTDLGPVNGRFAVASRSGTSGSSVDARLDLNETEWIEDARIVVETRGNLASLDTLSFRIPGLDLRAEGTIQGDSLTLETQLEAAYEGLVRRALGDTTLDASLSLQGGLSGSKEAPDVSVALEGRGSYGPYIVPEIRGDISYAEGRLETQIQAPRGLDLDQIRLDEVTVQAISDEDSLFPIELSLAASGPDLELSNALRLSTTAGWIVDVSSLKWVVRGQDLTTTRPFRLGFDPESRRISVAGLDLHGGLGRIWADGFLDPDSSDLNVDVSAVFPEKPPFLDLPEDLWPERLDLTLLAHGRSKLHGELAVAGFHLADRRDLTATLALEADGKTVRGSLSVGNDSGTLLNGKAYVPVTAVMYPFSARFGSEDLFAELILDGAPIPVDVLTGGSVEEGRIAQLDGRFVLGGTLAGPKGELTLNASFPGWPGLSRYGLQTRAELNGSGNGAISSDNRSEWRTEAMGAGLSSSLSLLRDGKEILTANASLPMRLSLHPYALLIPEGLPMEAHMDAERVDLSDLNGLLPPDVEVGGDLRMQLAASGPTSNPDLSGELGARKFRVSMANGTRTIADANVRLSGTGKKPEVQGRIEIQNGVIRIPEEQRVLHPTTGEAMLWELEELRPSAGVEGPSPHSEKKPNAPGVSEPPELMEMSLDVAVVIPSGLWIRGRGLDVELAGELNVEQKGKTLPTVTGELSAVRGQLTFLGRVFRIEKGQVVFYGGDEIDPSIDLLLSARVGDVVIRVLLGGTAQQPTLALSSDPEMTEGDIMAHLLFGRPLEELSSNQSEFLQSRAVDVAASYPLAKLEERLSRSLGVDMLSIRRAEGTDSQSSLVVGKYLTPRALLKYEQALESATSFFINLEYALSRHFKLETLIGTQGKSGIEIGWSK